MVRAPSQINPFPTVLQVSNDGGGGVRGCVTGCPAAAAGPALASVNVARLAAMIAGPLMSPMMVLNGMFLISPLPLSRFTELMPWLKVLECPSIFVRLIYRLVTRYLSGLNGRCGQDRAPCYQRNLALSSILSNMAK